LFDVRDASLSSCARRWRPPGRRQDGTTLVPKYGITFVLDIFSNLIGNGWVKPFLSRHFLLHFSPRELEYNDKPKKKRANTMM